MQFLDENPDAARPGAIALPSWQHGILIFICEGEIGGSEYAPKSANGS